MENGNITHPIRPGIVITGIGAVSPNGIGSKQFFEASIAGKSGISALPTFEHVKLKSTAAGQVLDFAPLSVMDAVNVRRVPRMIPMAIAASREALASARIDIDPENIESQRQIGVALGTGGGGLGFVEDQYRQFYTKGSVSLFSIIAGTHGNLSSELSIALKLRGPSHVLSTGCTSSTDALGHAAMLIRAGVVPMMLAGGADSPISPLILHGFENMRVIGTRRWDEPAQSSRPFSADRDGFILGEGAWMFILESFEHAQARGAPILAELAGYASTCDAYHRVQIAPQLLEPVRAIELALADAGATKDQVDYIAYHGTGTELNDRLETAAVKQCFGDRAREIPGSSIKSMIGHPQGACGAASIAATVLGMNAGKFHPTINLHNPDPACDLDYIPNQSRELDVNVALCNCIAFGSKNSAIVVRKA